MRKILLAITVLVASLASQAQFIHGSVKKNADPTKIDIVFQPTYNSSPGEYVSGLQFTMAIPVGVSAGVTAVAVGVNTFSNMGTLTAVPAYTEGSERIYSFIFANPAVANQSWTNGVDFIGAVVTFSTAAAATVGKMVDFTNMGGGTGFAYFSMATTLYDPTDYGNVFYAIPLESFTGNYPSGDQFVQTGAPTGCTGAVGGTATGSTSFCGSGTPTITASGYSSGVGSGYQWMSSANSANYPASGTPVAGQTNPASLTTGVVSTTTYYWLEVTCTSGTATDYSNMITVTVNPAVTPTVSITASPGSTICSGTSVTFTATPTNGGSTPTYQWKLNGGNVGTNSNTYANTSLVNGDIVTCVMTSNATCASPSTATSNAITMTVNANVTPIVSIAPSPGSTICPAASVTFTATPTNGGSTPAYQWKLNGGNVGTNSDTYINTSLVNGDIVTCVMTSNATCPSPATVTSNAITMTVNPNVTPSVSIAASPGSTICPGASVTFTATPTNGGSTPAYQWKLNGGNVGINSNTYTNAFLVNGDIVTCVMTSNANCAIPATATSNAITISVTSTVTPSVSIALLPGSTICSGTSVTFIATPTNGGSTPDYQWKLNGGNVGTNSDTYINASLANSDIVTCVMTSNNPCASPTTATSNAITMTVNTLPIVTCPGISSVCIDAASFTLTGALPLGGSYSGTGVSGGDFDPATAGTGTHTITYTYTDAGTGCSNSCTFTITVNPLPVVNNPVITTGQLSVPFSQTFTQTDGTAPITFSTVSTLPAGLTLSAAGVLSGTPTVTGTFPIEVTAADINGCAGTGSTYELVISAGPTSSVLSVSGPSAICNGASANLIVTITDGTSPYTVVYTDGTNNFTETNYISGTNIVVSPIDTTTYSLISVTDANLNPGSGESGTPAITVYPIPTVDQPVDQVVCNGELTAPVSFTGTIAGTEYNWVNNTTSIGLAANGTSDISSFTAINTGNVPVVATITVTPVRTFIASNYTYSAIPFNPLATSGTSVTLADDELSNAIPLNFDFNFYGNIYNQVYISSNGYISFNPASDPGCCEGELIPDPSDPNRNDIIAACWSDFDPTSGGTITYYTTGVSPNRMTVISYVNVPFYNTSNTVTSQVILYETSNNIEIQTTNVDPDSHLSTQGIENSDGTRGVSTPGRNNASWSATNSGVLFTATSSTCSGPSKLFTITVNPTPNAIATPSSQTICSGSAITTIALTGNVTGTVFDWVRDNTVSVTGIASSGAGDISGILTNTTNAPLTVTFTITPSYTNAGVTCTGTSITATVIVNPIPNAVATPSAQTICSGSAVTTITSTGNVTGTVYNWVRDNTLAVTGIAANGAGDISGTLTNTTNAPVTVTFTITPGYTNAGGTCTGTPVSATVVVNPVPNAVATPPAQTICTGSAITTIALSGNVAGAVYNWTRNNTANITGIAANGTGDISGTLANTTNAPITVTFAITPGYTNAGVTCTGTPITATVVVNPIPNAVATPASLSACSGTAITTVIFSGNVTGTVYDWTRNNTGTVTGIAASGTGNISGTLTNTTNAPVIVTFTVTPGYTNAGVTCTGTPITVTITVNPLPTISISSLPSRICLSDTLVNLVATPSGGVWSGPGILNNNFSPVRTAVGNYTLTYTYSTSTTPPCVATATVLARVVDCPERRRGLEQNGVILFPNPLNDGMLYMRVNSTLYSFLGINIYTNNGQLVHRQRFSNLQFGSVLPINLRRLAAGTYHVKVFYEGGVNRTENTFQIIIGVH